MEYKSIPLPREKRSDASIMEAFVAAGIRGDLLEELNQCRKCQEAFFMSNIATANGCCIESSCITDWADSHESDLRKYRPRYQYDREYQAKEIWNQWEIGLFRFTLPNH